ncbi:MAG: hypothetical protein KDA93_04450 [Planctomycetaceae bacterium]|nr:hypothetical protein [Planctomycetaceae bacterium]
MSETTRIDGRRVNREERRGEMIAALKELVAVEGPDVTCQRFADHIGRSDRYIAVHCGSWGDLRVAAGLPRKRSSGYSAEYLIQRLLDAEKEIDGPVSKRRFSSITGISTSTCDRVFGSWVAFRQAAGLSEVASPGKARRYSRELLLKLMREQLPILGRNMTRNQFSTAVGISTATIDQLGNWTELRSELGLTGRGKKKSKSFAEKLGIELFDEAPPLIDFSELPASLTDAYAASAQLRKGKRRV